MSVYRDTDDGALYRLAEIERPCGVSYAVLEAIDPAPSAPLTQRIRIDEETGNIDRHEMVREQA